MSPLTTSIASAAGVRVPNLTAGGSDFMPGDTDLLEAIPGYDSTPPVATLIRQIRETGAAIMIPTPGITPADGIIYATRSITATFSCPPLIVGSIMSSRPSNRRMRPPSGVEVETNRPLGLFPINAPSARPHHRGVTFRRRRTLAGDRK